MKGVIDFMENNFYDQERQLERQTATESLGRYTAKTFLLMFLGLLVTFGVAMFLSNTYYGLYAVVYALYYVPYIHLILLVAELAVVIGMTACLHKISTTTATVFFFLYSLLTGITFSVIFMAYQISSLILIFGATALYFGGMAVFGYVTNIDLSRMRNVLLGGLIFLIVMNVLMMFIPALEVADRVVCTLGVIIFMAYTAYDTQKIRSFYGAYQGDEVMLQKASIFSALQLYLDFVNMFLYLLRLLGKRKN